MVGVWYVYMIDFQLKGKDVIDVVQFLGVFGECVMCSIKSGVYLVVDFKGKMMGVIDFGLGIDELIQFFVFQNGIQCSGYIMFVVGVGLMVIVVIQCGLVDCVMIMQLMVGVLILQNFVYIVVDLVIVKGVIQVFGGDWFVVGVFVILEWVKLYKVVVQDVVDVLVVMMYWINIYLVMDIVNKMFVDFVKNVIISKVQYIVGLMIDKGQFFLDGIMFVGGLKIVYDMEKVFGVDVLKVKIVSIFDNSYVFVVNKFEGFIVISKFVGFVG